MGRLGRTRARILDVLSDHESMTCREIMEAAGLGRYQAYSALSRAWKAGYLIRTRKPIYSQERVFKGRGGSSQHTRPFHLYLLGPEGMEDVVVDGRRYVGFSEEYLDPRGSSDRVSKARRVLDFLRENCGEAFFSKDIVEALEEYGVRTRDIMSNVRRYERQGLVYVRGYKTDEAETPFRRGYLLTWLDQEAPRDQALSEAMRARLLRMVNMLIY